MTHPDLDAEQRHFDALYRQLEDEIDKSESRLADVRLLAVGGHPQARFEREAFAGHLEDRVAALRAHRRDDLCFGRIDLSDGDTLYIGRLGLSGDDHEPLLVDWRAPAAAPFYQATVRETHGVRRRRHFLSRGRRIVAIEDEVLDAEGMSATEAEALRGEAALQYAMNTARTGRMQEIASTIQREQDEIIRAPLTPTVFVQGGPGTGKTAVALHRAAYLLYTHRRRLAASDLLVIGPSPVFLRYIEHVLPSLGENGADLTSVPGVYARREWASDPDGVRTTKADPVMSAVIRRAIATRQRPIPRRMDLEVEGERVVITHDDTVGIVARGRRRRGRHNTAALNVHERLLRLVWERAGRAASDVMEFEDFRAEMLTRPRFRRISLRMWPTLTPEQLLNDLFGFPALLREATVGLLEPDAARALARRWSPDPADVAWSASDAALLDEAAEQLGPIPVDLDPAARRRAEAAWENEEERRAQTEYTRQLLSGLGRGMISPEALERRALGGRRRPSEDDVEGDATNGRTWRYAVVDEAQDLSAMEWRMIGRHAPRRAATVVGDLAQGTESWSARSWGDVRTALGAPADAKVSELTINYRTPTEISEFAAEILTRAEPGLAPPRSVRSVPGSLVFEPAVSDDLVDRAVASVVASGGDFGDGTSAVIVAPSCLEAVRRGVEHGLGLRLPEPGNPAALDAPVFVAAPEAVKGLEFDLVVLVDPAAVVAECGWRDLYVSVTRATRRLVVVHTGAAPLP